MADDDTTDDKADKPEGKKADAKRQRTLIIIGAVGVLLTLLLVMRARANNSAATTAATTSPLPTNPGEYGASYPLSGYNGSDPSDLISQLEADGYSISPTGSVPGSYVGSPVIQYNQGVSAVNTLPTALANQIAANGNVIDGIIASSNNDTIYDVSSGTMVDVGPGGVWTQFVPTGTGGWTWRQSSGQSGSIAPNGSAVPQPAGVIG